jgi:hypothetical protein
MGLVRRSDHFPDVPIGCGCSRQLALLGARPGRYMGMALTLSAGAALAALAVSASFFAGQALPAALGAFALSLALFLAIPAVEARGRAQDIEACMPFFLRGLGMLLQMGLPWRRAMEAAAKDSGALGEEINHALRCMDEGAGFHGALMRLAAFDSLSIKRALSQMHSAYDTGASGSEMVRVGDEMLEHDAHRMREHAAKSAMFSLLFVLFSALAPTFYIIYSVAGPLASGNASPDAGPAGLALLVVFPLLSALVLLAGKASMPQTWSSGGGGIHPLMLAPAAIMLAMLFILPDWPLAALAAGAAAGALAAYGSFIRERRLEEIDAALPDALFLASGMPESSGAQRVFCQISGGGFGALSEEAAKAERQLAMNVGVGAALRDFALRNPSAMVRRACTMMGHMVETNSLGKLGILADDMIRSAQAARERGRLFSMQKYTLMFGAFLMPAVFRMALSLSSSLAEFLGPEAGAGAGFYAAIPRYIVIYAAISSVAIADAEGRKSMVAGYSLALAAAGLAAFHLISF